MLYSMGARNFCAQDCGTQTQIWATWNGWCKYAKIWQVFEEDCVKIVNDADEKPGILKWWIKIVYFRKSGSFLAQKTFP